MDLKSSPNKMSKFKAWEENGRLDVIEVVYSTGLSSKIYSISLSN